ncbi:RGD1565926 (predicted), isoform CRA_a [Rattus norvegicus]|uniref:RGD1565926 (Predicted), isoform CRA_a n=1 Tax=Rattus norvegicus TaxID=10116 RepID=A6I843_RAT|nr:RGD1565926 (predicted), isoform CRA_a [Rattus norvegicus]EDM17834.1 RGD1565926 (predicted), isoform CRA_a [Rattus norvegicus]EDM17835.1 RGD1565926 (predicted), isoform CRA_a [Rattus norvegicus]
MSPKEAPATHGWAGCQGWQKEMCAGNKRGAVCLQIFPTTSWSLEM